MNIYAITKKAIFNNKIILNFKYLVYICIVNRVAAVKDIF